MAVAVDMGVPLDVCAKACEKLSPVEHRLEVMRVGDRVIIDDSYNSNPGGAANALEVLGCFPGKRVVVTPGMVSSADWKTTPTGVWAGISPRRATSQCSSAAARKR